MEKKIQNRLKVLNFQINPDNFSPQTSSFQFESNPTTHYQEFSNYKSNFSDVEEAPPDAILGLTTSFKKDNFPNKVNIGVGAFRDDEGKPYVLRCVKEMERRLLKEMENKPFSNDGNKEYSPQEGTNEFRKAAQRLIIGEENENVVTVQSISGTGALRLGVEFIKKFLPKDTAFYFPNPTWGNHQAICQLSGIPENQIRSYRYINNKDLSLDFNGLKEDLRKAPNGSVILLHVCAHNPTGVDPTEQQWMEIFEIMENKNLFPFFDNAYQGFASGDLEKDGFAVKYFFKNKKDFFCAQSFAKNLGLYGERIGAFHVNCSSPTIAKNVTSQLAIIIRGMYSSPPINGARIVTGILNDPILVKQWKEEMIYMSSRIKKMRMELYKELKNLNTPHPSGDPSKSGDWKHIINQIGMFSYTGLKPSQCEQMIKKYHIYMTKNGRISIAGLTTSNLKYVARAIHDCVINY
jgi:aspartate/tyrosine/aromatic aminotransferase